MIGIRTLVNKKVMGNPNFGLGKIPELKAQSFSYNNFMYAENIKFALSHQQ